MASSAKIISRLSSLTLKFNSKKSSLNASLLKSSSQSAMNRRFSLISRRIELPGDDDAAAQRNRIVSVAVELVSRLAEMGFSSSRYLDAFIALLRNDTLVGP